MGAENRRHAALPEQLDKAVAAGENLSYFGQLLVLFEYAETCVALVTSMRECASLS
jgi:hypothetical protein